MKITLRTSLKYGTDRGSDSFELFNALESLGAEVFIEPLDISPPVPQPVANSLTKHYPFTCDLTITCLDLDDRRLYGKSMTKSTMNILWTRHSSTVLRRGFKEFSRNTSQYDAILCEDELTYNALNKLTELPRGILSQGFESKPWSPARRDWNSEEFSFIMVLTGSKKENPELVIEVWNTLKRNYEEFENVTLYVKTIPEDDLNEKLQEHVPGLIIDKSNWSTDMFKNLYQNSHVMTCADSGGVRNRAALEFMSTGGAVIAPKWSLNTAWASSALMYPLEYILIEEGSSKDRDNKIALPDAYNLHEILVDIVRDKEKAKQRGRIASETIPAMLDWSLVVDRMFMTLNEIVELKGEILYSQYKRAVPFKEEPKWKK